MIGVANALCGMVAFLGVGIGVGLWWADLMAQRDAIRAQLLARVMMECKRHG